jgi:hypothetical protein
MRGPSWTWNVRFKSQRVMSAVRGAGQNIVRPKAVSARTPMNMLYEGLKEKGALMLIPSSAVESMGMGGLMGAAALRQSSLTGGGDASSEGRKQTE